jgi:hypothetical protein
MPHWSYASADLHIASLESKEPEPVASAGEPSTCLWRPPVVQGLDAGRFEVYPMYRL